MSMEVPILVNPKSRKSVSVSINAAAEAEIAQQEEHKLVAEAEKLKADQLRHLERMRLQEALSCTSPA